MVVRKLIISNILYVLHKYTIDVVSIIFDGASSNIAMCETLDAQLKQKHVEELVYILYVSRW